MILLLKGVSRFLGWYVEKLYLPFYPFSRAVRDYARTLRIKLGLKKVSARDEEEIRVPKVIPSISWNEICNNQKVNIIQPYQVDGNVRLRELAVLNALCSKLNPKNIFEIGTLNGRTALNLSINSHADVYTLDILPGMDRKYNEAMDFVGHYKVGEMFTSSPYKKMLGDHKITQLLGDSASFDYSPWNGKIDLFFIDGAHSRTYCENDTEVALKLINRSGKSAIVWHDYGIWQDVTAVLNEKYSSGLPLVNVKHTSLVVYFLNS